MKEKRIEELANYLLDNHSNGFGIHCKAITDILKKNADITFRELFEEIIKQGNEE